MYKLFKKEQKKKNRKEQKKKKVIEKNCWCLSLLSFSLSSNR